MKKTSWVALLAAAVCAPVWAASNSTAKITRVQLVVTDANPTDGIAPSFSFISNSAPLSVASGKVDLGDQHVEQNVMSSRLGQPKSVTLDNGNANMNASYMTDMYGPVSMAASGSALWSGGDQWSTALYDASAHWDSPPFYAGYVDFRLGAGTRLQLRILTDVQASTTIGTVMDQNGALQLEWAGGLAYVEIGALAADGSTLTSKQETRLYASSTQTWDPVLMTWTQFKPMSLAQSGWLEASFENTTAMATTGGLKLGVSVWGGSTIAATAVPEASALAYCAVGLALMATILRRRQRVRASVY
ncbi:hypothetical protein [Pelomonas sp. Root1237]|uniref:hypothetical protein n=1 Tax=Pelomonas sp. Root1237 TaxID=1736434 RepID=UPI000715EB0E|nr:hypothetical protein [Pelomonas sp. Root1237]KQV88193.1 hypothetical protein ASC91_15330 [Pelomonas sp. Root1237]